MTDPCGNLGETKFASPMKLSRKEEVFLVTKQRCVSVGSQKESFSTNENSGCKLLDQSECKFTLKHVEKRCFENRADC